MVDRLAALAGHPPPPSSGCTACLLRRRCLLRYHSRPKNLSLPVGILVNVPDQPGDPVQPKQRPLSWRWVAALMVPLAAFLGLHGLRALQPEPVAGPMRAGTVVVVGVTDRSSLTGSDLVQIDSNSNAVQFAAVSVRPRYIWRPCGRRVGHSRCRSNSRPVNGGGWYGFGNVTFAVCGAATLVLFGYLAHTDSD